MIWVFVFCLKNVMMGVCVSCFLIVWKVFFLVVFYFYLVCVLVRFYSGLVMIVKFGMNFE